MFRKDLNIKLWQDYELWTETPDTEEFIRQEFSIDADVFSDQISRRHFFKIMGASLALAGLTSCNLRPAKKIVTYVKGPEGMIPGKSIYYARTLKRGPYATGVLVESFMGRPIKIEGHPDHPMSLGGCDIFSQSEILTLYDPDRSLHPETGGFPVDFKTFIKTWKKKSEEHLLDQGNGLRFLCAPETSETFFELKKNILKKFPKAKFYSYEALKREQAFSDHEIFYDFTKTNVAVTFDCDFLSDENAGLRYANDFSLKRKNSSSMPRLYAIEADYTLSGSMADHRLAKSFVQIEELIFHLAVKLNVLEASTLTALSAKEENQLNLIAKELQNNKGKSLILAGAQLSTEAKTLVHLMNEALGNTNKTVLYFPSKKIPFDENISDLVNDMQGGAVKSLFILSKNPVYDLSHSLSFGEAIKKVPFSVCLGLIKNETSEVCRWFLPESQNLECWSDARALDGTQSINQPLIEPLFDSLSVIELLGIVEKNEFRMGHDLVKETFRKKMTIGNFESWWKKSLEEGMIEGTQEKTSQPKVMLTKNELRTYFKNLKKQELQELHLKYDPTIWDGRYANNGWLQELPKPISKTCWSNALFLSPALAEKKKLKNGDNVHLKSETVALELPVWIIPGLAEEVLILHLGYGRKKAGRVGSGIGHDAFLFMSEQYANGIIKGISISPNGKQTDIACTQSHFQLQSRDPIRIRNQNELDVILKEKSKPSLIDENPLPQSPDYAWGMSIDLNVCIGCNACVIGCQSENNIPIVGAEEVKRGREMHWLRIDRYFDGPPNLAKAYFQPLACVHCEKAPCEIVCPVAATSHSSEGINQMIYNRCVGTRYCSNNCPYKVRRFNFLDHKYRKNEITKMQANPEVSVRSRGVMEKCTYCIQRINEARADAEAENRIIRDGDIKTACQQVCPTKAIVFGNLKDPSSLVSHLHEKNESYELLGELGTLPRTRYLTRLTNPHPEFVV